MFAEKVASSLGMHIHCTHEHSHRTEHSDGPLPRLRLVPSVGPRDLPARGPHPHPPTARGDGSAPLLRPRHQHPDRDRRIGSCDPLAVEGGAISTEQAGFRGFGHAAIAVVIDVVLGLAFYALQGAPSWNPIVLINAYAQVLVTSTAEVLVC
jgi:hypothetical protein